MKDNLPGFQWISYEPSFSKAMPDENHQAIQPHMTKCDRVKEQLTVEQATVPACGFRFFPLDSWPFLDTITHFWCHEVWGLVRLHQKKLIVSGAGDISIPSHTSIEGAKS